MKIERLKELLSYNPETGIITWNTFRNNQVNAGDIAGYVHVKGYICIEVEHSEYKAHIIAWALYYGIWPVSLIDHKDRDKSNNRITNLREATKQQNCTNTKLYKNNRSGHRGVAFDKKSGKWRAYIRVNKKIKHLGFYKTAEEAGKVWAAFALDVYGDFTGQLK